MSLLPVKKTTSAMEFHPDWEPLRRFRHLLWDPFAEMVPFPIESAGATFTPPFEVRETQDAFVFKGDLPGLKETELDIKVTGDRLTISGSRINEKRDDRDTYFAFERSFGSFTRVFTLPQGVNTELARAELEAGVLTVTLPKLPEAQPKRIAVKTEGKVEGKAKA
jgi:HSP20 family protein